MALGYNNNEPSVSNGKTIFIKAITSNQISSKLPRSIPTTRPIVISKKKYVMTS